MSAEWYYHRGGKTSGPVSGERLQQLSAAGELAPDDLVWREGMPEWIAARSLGLMGSKPTSTGLPPPLPSGSSPVRSRAGKPISRRRHPAAAASNTLTMTWMTILLLVTVIGIGAGWYAHVLASSSAFANPRGPKDGENSAWSSSSPAESAARVSSSTRATRRVEEDATTEDTITEDSEESEIDSRSFRADADTKFKGDRRRPLIVVGGKSTEPAEAPEETGRDEPAESSAEQDPNKQLAMYQEIDVRREPSISIEGIPVKQLIHYRIVSQLMMEAVQETGARKVQQQVISAELKEADESSRSQYKSAMSEVKGLVLTYQVGKDGHITEFKGHKETRATTRVQRADSAEFVVSSLLDEDGWKELTRLTFFRPKPQSGSDPSWKDQMTHDWGPLGKWTGLTTFTPVGGSSELLQRFEYSHAMTYEPPGEAPSGLPFELKEANFEPLEAGGVIQFDPRLGQVVEVKERFHVRGQFNTDAAGATTAIEMEELQLLTIQLNDQMPVMEH